MIQIYLEYELGEDGDQSSLKCVKSKIREILPARSDHTNFLRLFDPF